MDLFYFWIASNWSEPEGLRSRAVSKVHIQSETLAFIAHKRRSRVSMYSTWHSGLISRQLAQVGVFNARIYSEAPLLKFQLLCNG